MNKQEQIEAKKVKPIEVGDIVSVRIPYVHKSIKTDGKGKKKTTIDVETNEVFVSEGEVTKISDGKYTVTMGSISIPNELNTILPISYNKTDKFCLADAKYVFPTFDECGKNPFAPEKRRINFYNQDIGSLLMRGGYGRRSDDFNQIDKKDNTKNGPTYGGVNFNPYIIDASGQRQYFQRNLVWTLEQKQLLLESIYHGIEIGKFLFRMNPWSKLEIEMAESGHGFNYDCVDGKQRFFAILHFLQNKYPDIHGNYWNDLSPDACWRFMSYANLSYGEMPEQATDQDVVDNFLTLNFTGTPMSEDHINYVKSFRLV